MLHFLFACNTTGTNKYPVDAKDTTIYTFADTMPAMVGGELKFKEYLAREIRYPVMERDLGVEGTLYASFIVEKDGRITYPSVMKEIDNGPGFSREAIRVIRRMPNWIPAV